MVNDEGSKESSKNTFTYKSSYIVANIRHYPETFLVHVLDLSQFKKDSSQSQTGGEILKKIYYIPLNSHSFLICSPLLKQCIISLVFLVKNNWPMSLTLPVALECSDNALEKVVCRLTPVVACRLTSMNTAQHIGALITQNCDR